MWGPQAHIESDFQQRHSTSVGPTATGHEVTYDAVVETNPGNGGADGLGAKCISDREGEQAHLLSSRVIAGNVRPISAERTGRGALGAGHEPSLSNPAGSPRHSFVSGPCHSVGMNQHQVTARTAQQVREQYTPRCVDPFHWVTIRAFVMDAVAAMGDKDTEDTRRFMTQASQYVDWTHFVAGYDLDKSIWDADIIAEYLDSETKHLTPLVREATKGRLMRMARTNNPGAIPEIDDIGFKGEWQPDPYTDDEVRSIEGWARGQRTPVSRQKAAMLLALGLGAGLHTSEMVLLRVYDLEPHEGGITINVRGSIPRQVPVRNTYVEPLRLALQHLAPADYVFAAGRVNKKTAVIQNFIKTTNTEMGWRPSPRRLRSTWMLAHIKAGVPASYLMRAAGVTSLRYFEKWIYSYPELHNDEYSRWLWGSN